MTVSAERGRRLRVMQVTHDLGIGGLPRVVVTLARTLDPERFDVSVLCMRGRGGLAEELEEAGIPVRLVPSPRQPDRLATLRVARILRKERVDVLHTHNTQPFLEGGLAALLVGVRAHIHTDHGREFPDRRRYMWAERLMSRFAHRVVGVSEQTSRQLVRWEKIDPRKVTTIENGVDGMPFRRSRDPDAVRAALGLGPDALVVGTVARFQPEKGVDVLLRALPSVVREEPRAVCLIVGYGPAEPELRELALELGLGERVRFLGARSDVPELLSTFDCYALPSRREGLPMVILEAMAAGCPIVATRVGGVPGAIEDGETGDLVPPEEPAAMAAAILAQLRDPERRRAYAGQARRRFRDRFSATAMARRYEALYLEAAGEPDDVAGAEA